MKRNRMGLATAAFTMLTVGISGVTFGQDKPADPAAQPAQPGQGQGRQRGQGGQGGRGNFDPAAMRQQQMDRIKTQLGSSDDEWKVLQPKIEKVMEAQRAGRAGFGGGGAAGGRRRGGNNADSANPPADAPAQPEQSAVAKATTELRTAVADKDSTPEVYAAKLKALRDAKDKAKVELASAQKDLQSLLTPKQEAILVSNGVLD